MTTKPEHDTHEQPLAANYTAGDSFEQPHADRIVPTTATNGTLATIPASELPALPQEWQCETRVCPALYTVDQVCAYAREALAASHREPSGRGEPSPITTAPKDGTTRILLCDEGGDWYFGFRPVDCPDDAACNELGIACYPKYWKPSPPPADSYAAPPSQPADKPAGQAVTDAPKCVLVDRDLLESAMQSLYGASNGVQNIYANTADEIKSILSALAPEPATAGDVRRIGGLAWWLRYMAKRTIAEGPFGNAFDEQCLNDWAAAVERIEATPAAAVPEGMVLIKQEAIDWLNGESDFECPPDRYFRGEPPRYWWRSVFREKAGLVAAAPNRPADAQRGVSDGIELAARWVEARRDEFYQENGRPCPETGAWEFGRGRGAELKEEYVGELTEIADGIRKLAASPADPLPASEVSP